MVVIGCWFGIELPDRSMLNGLSVLRTATLVLAIVSVGATYFAWEYSDAALLDDGVSDLVKQVQRAGASPALCHQHHQRLPN